MVEQQYYEEPQQQESPISRQIGPLKAWQWGIVVGVAFLIFRYVRGSGSSSSGSPATVQVPSSDASAGTGGVTSVSVSKVTDTIGGLFRATFTKAGYLYDKNGHRLRAVKAGAKFILGAKVKLNGKWYYPVLNVPGAYVLASSNVNIVPYTTTTTTTTTTTPSMTAQVMSPTTTSSSNPTPSPFSSSSLGIASPPSWPTVDKTGSGATQMVPSPIVNR